MAFLAALGYLRRCSMKASRGTMVKAKTPEGYRLSAVKSEPPVVRARKRCMQAAGTAGHRSGQQTSSRSSAPPVTIDLSEQTESDDDVEPRAASSLKKARRSSQGLSSACFHRARQRRSCTYVAHHLLFATQAPPSLALQQPRWPSRRAALPGAPPLRWNTRTTRPRQTESS